MRIEDCKTGEEYRNYAIYNSNITDDQMQLCLDRQSNALSHLWFAELVSNLKPKHVQQCLDKMETKSNYRNFMSNVPNLTKKQKQQCLDKMKQF